MSSESRRRALVTGAGSGIGRAITESLFADQCDVALLGRRAALLEAVASSASASGATPLILPADLADRRSTDRAMDVLLAAWPRLDIVVLNAGIGGSTPMSASDTRDFDRILETNLTSAFRVLRRLVPAMGKGGRIVLIGSVLGRFGIPEGHGYCASKAGVMGLCRGLALDLAPKGITVNAILPGWVETEMSAASIARRAPALKMTPAETQAMFAKAVPIGRFLEPAEIARAVVFLAAPEAGGITGQAINVCGGAMA